MNENTKKIITWVIAIVALLLIGFFVGRSTIKTKTVKYVRYIKGDTIEVEVDKPVPVYVNKPVDTTNVILAAIESGDFNDLFPEKVRDSIIYVTKDDTSAVIADWATERYYEQQLFDIDTVGTAIVKANVQYNRLTHLSGIFTPVVKEVNTTEYLVKRFSPFVGIGLSVMPNKLGGNNAILKDQSAFGANVQAGAFFNEKYGFGISYEYGFNLNTHTFSGAFLYKF